MSESTVSFIFKDQNSPKAFPAQHFDLDFSLWYAGWGLQVFTQPLSFTAVYLPTFRLIINTALKAQV